MTMLARIQDAMMSNILDEELAMPENWTARHAAGLAIYRNNYRSALLDALKSTFERTERHVGAASFERAAAHHLITNPPSSWTLDLAGEGFDETCGQLFANDPEVAELAWLEWAMHRTFVARDARPVTMTDFATATAQFSEQDWTNLRLCFVPGIAARRVNHDLKDLWSALSLEGQEVAAQPLGAPACAVVWREGERPAFILVQKEEGQALSAMMHGSSYSEVCETLVGQIGEQEAVELAGAMLGRWISEGLVESIAQ